jgi:hypothetical protein
MFPQKKDSFYLSSRSTFGIGGSFKWVIEPTGKIRA